MFSTVFHTSFLLVLELNFAALRSMNRDVYFLANSTLQVSCKALDHVCNWLEGLCRNTIHVDNNNVKMNSLEFRQRVENIESLVVEAVVPSGVPKPQLAELGLRVVIPDTFKLHGPNCSLLCI